MRMLYVVDFSNFSYKFRSTYNLSQRIEGVNVNTSVPFGWIRSLKSIPFKDVLICLDGEPIQMYKILPSYKGQRMKEPEDSVSFPYSKLILMLTLIGKKIGKNVYVVFNPGQEADQVISSIAHMVAKKISPIQRKILNSQRVNISEDSRLQRLKNLSYQNLTDVVDLSEFHSMVVATTDSDMYQLLRFDEIFIDTSTSGKEIQSGTMTPKAVLGLKPSCIPSYKALVGDMSDHVSKLSLDMSLDCTIALINKSLDTPDKLLKFADDLKFDRVPEKGLASLFKKIKETNQVNELLTNIAITYLTFYSEPYVFKCDGDVDSILKKYSLKV